MGVVAKKTHSKKRKVTPLRSGSRNPSIRKLKKELQRAGHDRKTRRQVVRTAKGYARARKLVKREGRRNPAEAAAALHTKFHGKAPDKFVSYKIAQHQHAFLVGLGRLVSLDVRCARGVERIFPRGVRVACSEDGGQIYFVGGDQSLDPKWFGVDTSIPKDHVDLGELVRIEYHTTKDFHDFEPIDYYHAMGEKGGQPPILHYDVRSKLLYLTGGTYRVERRGIVH